MGKYEISREVMEARQAWFWRRTTLQVVLAAMILMLMSMVFGSVGHVMDWPTAVVEMALMVAIVWLVTMYFASVDSAEKVAHVIKEAVDAINLAQEQSGGASG